MDGQLVVHCGGFDATREQVRAARPPLLKATQVKTKHLAFADFEDMIEEQTRKANLKCLWDQARYALADGKRGQEVIPAARMFGLVPVAVGGQIVVPELGITGDWCPQIGFRNSYDGTFAAGAVMGQRVFICDNLAFHGEYNLAAKNTHDVYETMAERLREAAQKMFGWIKGVAGEVRLMKEIHPSRLEIADILCEGIERNLIPGSKMAAILRAVKEPNYQYDETPNGGSPSMWRVLNAVTEAQRDRSVRDQFRTGGGILNVFRAHGLREARERLASDVRAALEQMERETATVYAQDATFAELN